MRFKGLQGRLSYANVIATLALFFALTGGATAGLKYMANGDPAGGDLTGTYPNPTIAANAVESAEVVDGSLRTPDYVFASGTFQFCCVTLAPGECTLHGTGVDGLQLTDLAIIMPEGRYRGTVEARIDFAAGTDVALWAYVCNPTPNPVSPTTMRYLVLR